MTGTGAAPALLTISDSPTYTYPTLAVGSTSDKTLTISNAGGVSAIGMSGSGLTGMFAFKGGTYPGSGGTCAASLAPTLTCTVVITYAPTTVASHSATVTMNYNDGVNLQISTRALAGTAVADGLLTISDGATFDFSTVAIGATLKKNLRLRTRADISRLHSQVRVSPLIRFQRRRVPRSRWHLWSFALDRFNL